MSSIVPWLDIRSKIEAAALLPPECIQWPNERFSQPSGELWMAVEATGDTLEPVGVDGVVWQESGRAYVHIFTPVGQGSVDARTLAKAVANVFRGIPGPSVVTYYGASIGVGQAANVEGNWWLLSVDVQWRYQDQTTGV